MRKLQTFWQNLHLRAKFLLILLVGIVIIGVDAIATLLIPLRAYDEQLYESSSQMISLYAEQIKHEMKNYEDISYRILTDSSLQENLAIIKDASPGTLTWIEAQRNVASRAAYYSLWFSNTVSFQLRTSRGTTYSHFFRASTGANELTDERMTAAAWRQGRFIWLTEENGDASRLFLVREIREMENMTLDNLGYMLIEVDFPSLVEQYSQAMGSLGVEPRCAVYNKGICLYASDDGIRALGMGEDGYTYMKSDGKPVLCVRYTATNGLKYVTLVDYSGIRTTTLAAVSVTILCILGAALLVVAVSTGLINSILVHFQVLMQKFDAFAINGEPISAQESACYKDRFDEIGDLHRGFDWMTREWTRVNHEKEEQQHRKRHAQHTAHGDDRIHHLVSEFLFEPFFKFRGLFLFLAAHFIRRKRQRLHTEAQGIHHREHATYKRLFQNGVFFAQRRRGNLLRCNISGFVTKSRYVFLRANHQNALKQGLPADRCYAFCHSFSFCL